ncbi:MAG: hypothetical protein M3Z20_20625 [Chloroflexota bacterium]|nr:hypothetical protein [Chloroflexota bacterium]
MARKYEPLAVHLGKQGADEITMTFAEVEALVGKLPQSAHEYRQWWENSTSQVEAKDGWLAAGWKVAGVDQSNGIVTFRRQSN